MDDVSLSPMHNAGIYRTHWAIQKNMNREKSRKKKFQKQNKHIKSAKLQSKRGLAHHDAAVADECG
jgi:hypothetical protein